MVEIHLSSRRIFNKYIRLALIALVITACGSKETAPIPNTDEDPQPVASRSNVTPVTGLGLSIPPNRTFSIQNANKIAPEDILEEVSFGGFGGGGYCEITYDKPTVESVSDQYAWLFPISIFMCGWRNGESVKITLETPDGKFLEDTAIASNSGIVLYEYHPSFDSQLGNYKFDFSGEESGNIQYVATVFLPDGPRMIYLETDQSYYLYGFYPNERIRFFQYSDQIQNAVLEGWKEYNVDINGQLIIELRRPENTYYYTVGDLSGEVNPNFHPMGLFNIVKTPADYKSSITVLSGTDAASYLVSAKALGQLAIEKYSFEERNKVNQTLTFTIQLDTSEPIIWRWYWCAKNKAILQDNMRSINVQFILDGEDITNQFGSGEFTYTGEPMSGWACFTYEAVLTDWETGVYDLEQNVNFVNEINDGKDLYPAGFKIYDYTVTVK